MAVSRIVYTSGEPGGIGPDLCAAIARSPRAADVTILGDRPLIESRVRARGADPCALHIEHVPLRAPVTAGRLDPANAPYVLSLLDHALAGCRDGTFAAMVTAPIHKGVINDARLSGSPFTGHTEYLAEKTATKRVVMMLAGGGLRVALATTHLPLKDVPAALTRDSLSATLEVLHAELIGKFGIAQPRILVAGLNPHAGEGGHLGREEIDVIAPVVEAARAKGMRVTGPLPADTLFTPRHLAEADAVLAMYHDQGLAPLKYASFGHAVNVTLGLPIIRTSVDHGTALDLAASGAPVDTGSLDAALDMAFDLAGRATGGGRAHAA
ncbi:MAG: 4-hydroxythreonine-4-phosphate dehydrogenase PdxA [Betaproteobacteria bacterium]|nr:4-hydroxythreonine-4-phosphate dehydrogenase PdxA [Betaproteobacteria bacterium]